MEAAPRACSTCFATAQFPNMVFDAGGRCQRCTSTSFADQVASVTDSSRAELILLAGRIKQKAQGGKYDCIIGVSGGLDSSYVAYIARRLMGLNPLLVHYDHGFFYSEPRQNLERLAQALGCDLKILESKGQWDQRYVRYVALAFRKMGLYWGVCSFCHYILGGALNWMARRQRITTCLNSTNMYELELHVPRQVKLNAMVNAVRRVGLLRLPVMIFYLALAQYCLFRLKLEFYTPPLSNLVKRSPKNHFEMINLTRYVPWDVDEMHRVLKDEVGWQLPDRPNLGMRFDCLIEDAFINHTYQQATGATIHSIVANNLIYAGVRTKEQLAHVVDYYDHIIAGKTSELFKKLKIKNRP